MDNQNNNSSYEMLNKPAHHRHNTNLNPTRAVVNGFQHSTQAVRGGISQVEKGAANVGNKLNKVPGVTQSKGVLSDYRKFLDRGNVVDLAVAVVIGAAFTAIVTSLVTDIITPLLSLASSRAMEENFVVLKNPNATALPFTTRLAAKTAGAVTLNWGNFVQTIINFFIISAFIFVFIKIYQMGRNEKKKVTDKKCDYCKESIPIAAVKCGKCATWLDWDTCAKVEGLRQGALQAAGLDLHQSSSSSQQQQQQQQQQGGYYNPQGSHF